MDFHVTVLNIQSLWCIAILRYETRSGQKKSSKLQCEYMLSHCEEVVVALGQSNPHPTPDFHKPLPRQMAVLGDTLQISTASIQRSITDSLTITAQSFSHPLSNQLTRSSIPKQLYHSQTLIPAMSLKNRKSSLKPAQHQQYNRPID